MLNLGDINKEARASTEGLLAGISFFVIAFVAVVLFVIWGTSDAGEDPVEIEYEPTARSKPKQHNREKSGLKKLLDRYTEVCKYVNTELKDDPFFFKEQHSNMFKLDSLMRLVNERKAKVAKIISMPAPSSSDTEETYCEKLYRHFGTVGFDMSQEYYQSPIKSTYKDAGWLDAAKVHNYLQTVIELDTMDQNALSVVYKYCSSDASLKDGTSVKHCVTYYLGRAFNPESSYGMSACSWMGFYQQRVTKHIFLKMAKHLTNHLSSRYGKDAVKIALRRCKVKA